LIILYTDGSHNGNIGAWAACYYVPDGIPPVSRGGLLIGCPDSTEAEIMACICALKRVATGSDIILHTDFLPIVEFFGGRTKKLFRPTLRDLISETERHASVRFRWIKGHKSDQYNNAVDKLARRLLREA
jgi:ribonuclease HI